MRGRMMRKFESYLFDSFLISLAPLKVVKCIISVMNQNRNENEMKKAGVKLLRR